jgi:hypothetical protein
MSRDNPLWGSERIRGELLKLGIVVSKRSIRRYRWRKPILGGTQTWRTFLANELRGIWAADLLVVQTINYRVVYVLFFITHDRRELVHFKVTSNPTAAWIWQQVVEATPWDGGPTTSFTTVTPFTGATSEPDYPSSASPASEHLSGPQGPTRSPSG